MTRIQRRRPGFFADSPARIVTRVGGFYTEGVPVAGDWIKMRHDLADDPAVIALSSRTGTCPEHVVGCLHKLWSWADRHTVNGHVPSVPMKWIDDLVGVDKFAEVLLSVGWLEKNERDNQGDICGFTIPKFHHHISESAKKRALETRRKRIQRSRKCPADVPANSGPEKRREEKKRKERREERSWDSILSEIDLGEEK